MPKLPESCPACASPLVITQLTCTNCETQVNGHFEPDLFSRLAPNDFDFVVLFVKAKGNIKEMERELGISYWTIRNKLAEIVDYLELESKPPSREELSLRRQAILEQLQSGDITVEQATNMLEALKKHF